MKFLILTAIIVTAIAVTTIPRDPIVIPLYYPKSLKSNFTKYGDKISRTNQQNIIVQKRGLDSLNLRSNEDIGYIGAFSIGTPSRKFFLHIDTGSHMLLLIGNKLRPTCRTKNLYNPKKSSSCRDWKEPCSTKYVKGGGSGFFFDDYVSVTGMPHLGARHQFCVADKISSDIVSDTMDGIIGFGYRILTQETNPLEWTFFQTLFYTGIISKGIFALYFARDKYWETGSHLILGGYDLKKIASGPYYNRVISSSRWVISIDSVNINDYPVLVPFALAQIDSGTSHILAPLNDAKIIHRHIRGSHISKFGSNYYVIPCMSFPSFSFTFNKITYPISHVDINLGQDHDQVNCISAITILPGLPIDEWILGLSFLKNVYTIFDLANGLIGFAFLKASDYGVTGPTLV